MYDKYRCYVYKKSLEYCLCYCTSHGVFLYPHLNTKSINYIFLFFRNLYSKITDIIFFYLKNSSHEWRKGFLETKQRCSKQPMPTIIVRKWVLMILEYQWFTISKRKKSNSKWDEAFVNFLSFLIMRLVIYSQNCFGNDIGILQSDTLLLTLLSKI